MAHTRAVIADDVDRVHYIGINGIDPKIIATGNSITSHFRQKINSLIPFFREVFGQKLIVHSTGGYEGNYDFAQTRSGLEDTLFYAAEKCTEKSMAVLSMCMHGYNDGRDWYFFFNDSYHMTMRQLIDTEDFRRLASITPNIVFVVDSCFSGFSSKFIGDRYPIITSADVDKTSHVNFSLQSYLNDKWTEAIPTGIIDLRRCSRKDWHPLTPDISGIRDYGSDLIIVADNDEANMPFYHIMAEAINNARQYGEDQLFWYDSMFREKENVKNDILDYARSDSQAAISGRLMEFYLFLSANRHHLELSQELKDIIYMIKTGSGTAYFDIPQLEAQPKVDSAVVSLTRFCRANSPWIPVFDHVRLDRLRLEYFNRVLAKVEDIMEHHGNPDDGIRLSYAMDALNYIVPQIHRSFDLGFEFSHCEDKIVDRIFEQCFSGSVEQASLTSRLLRDNGFTGHSSEFSDRQIESFKRYLHSVLGTAPPTGRYFRSGTY